MTWWNPLTWGRSQPLREAYLSPYGVGLDTEGPHADRFFRSIGALSFRDLPPHERDRVLLEAWHAYSTLPLARRGLDIVAHYVTGEGLTFKAKDERVQAVLDKHWRDPINRWDMKQHQRALEIFMFGEQFWPTFTEEFTGQVRLGYVDPIQVAAVVTDPENVEVPRWVVLKSQSAPGGLHQTPPIGQFTGADFNAMLLDPDFDPEADPLWLRVIQPDEDPESPTFGRLVGDVHYFAVNRCSSCVRGISSLLPVIDFLDMHEQFLMEAQEAAALKNKVFVDVTCEGADDARIDELKARQGRIKFGQERWHNEKVVFKTVQPELGTSEIEQHANMVKRHIAAGLGIPAHWLSEGSEASKATALAMGEPTTKSLRAKQRMFRDMVSLVLEHVVDQAVVAGTLPADVDTSFRVITPPIWPTDIQQIGASMLSIAQALLLAVESGWKSKEQAALLFDYAADQLGMEASAFDDETQRPTGSGGIERDGGRMPGLDEMTAMQMRLLRDDAMGLGRSVPGNGNGGD